MPLLVPSPAIRFAPSAMTGAAGSRLLALALVLAAMAGARPQAAGDPSPMPEFHTPDHFEITRFAGADLVHDVYKLTFDSHGRLVVTGRNTIAVLHDDNDDGRADRAERIAEFPATGARGICFIGDDAIISAADGIYRLPVSADGGALDVDARVRLMEHSGGGDHTANGLRHGPDGWLYLITGDNAGIGAEHASLPGSPLDRALNGALVRIAVDGSGSQVLADGLRNPYDLAFDSAGNVITWDADGERVHHLPWFVPTRLFSMRTGASHGWLDARSNYWNPPGHFFDHARPLAELGRGSPTGVEVYRHRAFPPRYHGGVFLADWSFGRILFHPLPEDDGAEPDDEGTEVFVEAVGGGFAVTALAVGPEGDLFASVGGRDTRGAVYRIRHRPPASGDGDDGDGHDEAVEADDLRRVLGADQPLASWSRARWVPLARGLGRGAFEAAAMDPGLSLPQRRRAVEVLVEVFDGIDPALGRRLVEDPPAGLIARVLWAVARSQDSAGALELLAGFGTHADGRVALAAWEGLMWQPGPLDPDGPASDYLAAFDHDDERVRLAAMLLARRQGRRQFVAGTDRAEPAGPRQQVGYLFVRAPELLETREGRARLLERAAEAFDSQAAADGPADAQLDLVRLAQIGLGDLVLPPDGYGYTAGALDQVDEPVRRRLVDLMVARFPIGEPELDHELARLAAMLGEADAGFLDRLAVLWTADSTVPDDIHHLMVASHVAGPRGERFRAAAAAAITGLQPKLAEAGEQPTRHWPMHVQAMVRRLAGHDPELVDAVVGHPRFTLAEHALLAGAFDGEGTRRAATRLFTAAEQREAAGEPALTTELVELLAALQGDERVRSLLRRHAGDAGLQAAIIPLLANRPDEEDRPQLLAALGLLQPTVVTAAATALAGLEPPPGEEAPGAVVRALWVWCGRTDDEAPAVRRALSGLLAGWTDDAREIGGEREGVDPGEVYRPWFVWLAEAHPQQAALHLPTDDDAAAGFERRLAEADFTGGDAVAGEHLFAALGCMACHAGPARIGPELAGITRRFDGPDLMRMINEPSRLLGPDASVTTIVTRSGDSHRGRLVYASPAVNILRTAAGGTVHVAREQVERIEQAREPLMPGRLLEHLDAGALAALHAYLRQLDEDGAAVRDGGGPVDSGGS